MDLPVLSKLADSMDVDEAMIIIKGYLSDKVSPSEVSDDYLDRLRDAGWRGAVYHLWWDASDSSIVPSTMGAGSADSRPLMMGPIPMGSPLGARYHWSRLKKRAKRTGRDHVLKLIKDQVTESKVSLLGHSMGARVVYYLMRTVAYKIIENPDFKFENVYLLGGAVRRDSAKEWAVVVWSVRGQIVNVHNKDDKVLSVFYRAAELRQNACGRKRIKEVHPQIVNVDARFIINNESHGAYRRYLSKTIAGWFHR